MGECLYKRFVIFSKNFNEFFNVLNNVKEGAFTNACICIGTHPVLQNRLMGVYQLGGMR